jgi:hypothetical protein
MIIDYMQDIITIIDNNKHLLSDKDYIDICTNLEKIYEYNNNDNYFDDEYVSERQKKFIHIINISIVLFSMIIFGSSVYYEICKLFTH